MVLSSEARETLLKKSRESSLRTQGVLRAKRAGSPQIDDIDQAERTAIILRDEGTCYLCGKKPREGELTLDHVIPLTRSGSHTSDNLRVACLSCNSRKGNRLLSEIPAGTFPKNRNRESSE